MLEGTNLATPHCVGVSLKHRSTGKHNRAKSTSFSRLWFVT
jgi:hypothetical protein